METKTFRLIGLDEGGIKQSQGNGNLRLVCLIKGGGKLAVWGSVGSRVNIDSVQRAGMPCNVECDCITPKPWGTDKGHSYWVPEGTKLRVLSKWPQPHRFFSPRLFPPISSRVSTSPESPGGRKQGGKS